MYIHCYSLMFIFLSPFLYLILSLSLSLFTGATAYSGAYFGLGKGPIHIDDAVCTGDETNITQCAFTSNDNCLHSNDAGVR